MSSAPVCDWPCIQCAHMDRSCRVRQRNKKLIKAREVDLYLPELINSLEEILGQDVVCLKSIVESHKDLMTLGLKILSELKKMRVAMSGGASPDYHEKGNVEAPSNRDDTGEVGLRADDSDDAPATDGEQGSASGERALSPELGVPVVASNRRALVLRVESDESDESDGQAEEDSVEHIVKNSKHKAKRGRDESDYSPEPPSKKAKRAASKSGEVTDKGSDNDEHVMAKGTSSSARKNAIRTSETPVASSSKAQRSKKRTSSPTASKMYSDDDGDTDIIPRGDKRKPGD
ncbi:hypothetical protein LXA43DRAFT_1064218, partial [Ganoderma leucocontextum]